MRIRLRRPRYQRNARILLAFALVIPAATVTQVAGPNPASRLLTVVLLALAGLSVYDAFRRIIVVNRHGIGIVGVITATTTWIAWGEITRIEAEGPVVSLTTRDRAIYQVQVDSRGAALFERMIRRRMLGRVL